MLLWAHGVCKENVVFDFKMMKCATLSKKRGEDAVGFFSNEMKLLG